MLTSRRAGALTFPVVGLAVVGLSLSLGGCGGTKPLSTLADGQAGTTASCPDAIGATQGFPALSVSHDTVTLQSGEELKYTATVGYLPLGQPGVSGGPTHACMFFFAYTRDDKTSDAGWPVTFLSNGGPGSPSDWLQLGGLGPKVIGLGQDGLQLTGNELGDDKESLLGSSDLVFVDPVTTGYSRVAQGIDPQEFDGQVPEAQSLGDFIQAFGAKFGRAAAPVYVLGESYGGMRLPVLGRYLDETLHIKPAGLIFVSPWLDALQDDTDDVTNDLPYATQLPQYAATAWYHGKLAPELEAQSLETVWEEASAFADGDFLSALVQGDDLAADRLTAVAAMSAHFTGVTADVFASTRLRYGDSAMVAGILGKTNALWSAYDGRMVEENAPAGSDPYDRFDPIWAGIEADYFPKALGIKTDLKYQANEYSSWPAEDKSGYMRSVEDLAAFMANNPAAKVFVASGLFDFVCPAARVHFQLRHMPPEAYSRLQFGHYPGGHPVYFGEGARTDFVHALSQFIGQNVGES